MSAYLLHVQGDCNPYSCPMCEHEEPQTVVELIEQATGLNGETTLERLRAHGLDVVRTEAAA